MTLQPLHAVFTPQHIPQRGPPPPHRPHPHPLALCSTGVISAPTDAVFNQAPFNCRAFVILIVIKEQKPTEEAAEGH